MKLIGSENTSGRNKKTQFVKLVNGEFWGAMESRLIRSLNKNVIFGVYSEHVCAEAIATPIYIYKPASVSVF